MKLTQRRSMHTCGRSPANSAPAVVAFTPMQDLVSGKVSTDPNQSERGAERVGLALPKPDTWIRALDPLPVVFVKVNRRASEGLAPLDHR